jgi:hypothetical protein
MGRRPASQCAVIMVMNVISHKYGTSAAELGKAHVMHRQSDTKEKTPPASGRQGLWTINRLLDQNL